MEIITWIIFMLIIFFVISLLKKNKENYVVFGKHRRYLYPWYYKYGRFSPWYLGYPWHKYQPAKYSKNYKRWHQPHGFYYYRN